MTAQDDSRPVMRYDGDCGFCRRRVERWRRTTGDRVVYRPAEDPLETVELIMPDGTTAEGAEAVFRALATAPGRGALLWCYRRLPGFAAVSEAAYRFIASHRSWFS